MKLDIMHLRENFDRAIVQSEVATIGFRAHASEFFRGFVVKRLCFTIALLDNGVNLVAKTAWSICSLVPLIFAVTLGKLANKMDRTEMPEIDAVEKMKKHDYSTELNRTKDIFQQTFIHLGLTILSGIGIVAPMATVAIVNKLTEED